MANKSAKNYFPALTGVRALAAILVFLTHFGYILAANAPAGVQRYFNELSLGLPMFFVLTGFLITVRYYESFAFTWQWYTKFSISRFARLYPMYMLFTFAAFGYYLYSNNPSIVSNSAHPWYIFFLNATFLRGFFDDLKFSGVGQGWSITVDVVFYLIVPLVFYFIKRYNRLVEQPLLFLIFGSLLVLVFKNFSLDGFFSNFKFAFYYSFFGRSVEIYTGIWLALKYQQIKVNPKSKFKYTYAGGAIMLLAVWLFTLVPLAPGEQFGITTGYGIVLSDLVLVPGIAMFYLGLVREDTRLSRFLSGKRMQLLSNASFIFYLIHLGVVHDMLHEGLNKLNDAAFALYDKMGLDWHSPFEYDALNVFYILAALFAISIFVYKRIEEPLNRKIRNMLMATLYKKDPPVADLDPLPAVIITEN